MFRVYLFSLSERLYPLILIFWFQIPRTIHSVLCTSLAQIVNFKLVLALFVNFK